MIFITIKPLSKQKSNIKEINKSVLTLTVQNLPTYQQKINTPPFYSPKPIPSKALIKSLNPPKKSVSLPKEGKDVPGSPWIKKELSYKYNELSLKLAVAASLKDILMSYDKKIKPDRSNEILIQQAPDIGITESNINQLENNSGTLLAESVLSPIEKYNNFNKLVFTLIYLIGHQKYCRICHFLIKVIIYMIYYKFEYLLNRF